MIDQIKIGSFLRELRKEKELTKWISARRFTTNFPKDSYYYEEKRVRVLFIGH